MITDAQLAKGYEQAKEALSKPRLRCLCGAAYVDTWTAGVHHQEHRCARVITRVEAQKRSEQC